MFILSRVPSKTERRKGVESRGGGERGGGGEMKRGEVMRREGREERR